MFLWFYGREMGVRAALLLLLTMIPMFTHADGFTGLWKQVEVAQGKDLPKDEQKALQVIVDKALAEEAYGHLLKAQLQLMRSLASVSPDSLEPAVMRMVQAEEKAREKNPVLSMVYSSVLGHLYAENRSLGDDRQAVSRSYFERSLSQPALLAERQARDYVPLVKMGKDSRVFGNDLLSVLCYEAGNMSLLHDYYEKSGNRAAAMITALELAKTTTNTKRKGEQLDSLMALYGDLDACGEVAIARYELMDDVIAPAEKRIAYIDQVLEKWGSWPRMNELRNARQQLTEPVFNARLGSMVQLPGKQRTVRLDKIRNVREVTMTVSRLKLDASTKWNADNDTQYAKLKKAVERVVQKETRRYQGLAEWQSAEDSMTINALPVGLYLVEMNTDNKKIRTDRCLYYVTDLYVLSTELPGRRIRYAVVSGTTGQPVPGARLRVKYNYRSANKPLTENLTCGEQGEVIYDCGGNNPNSILVTTDKDKYLPETSLWNSFSFYENKETSTIVSLYTDRTLYRPGQTVHVAAVAFKNERGLNTCALSNQPLKLMLRDANNKVVEEKQLTTDDYGTASADFVLPTGKLNGSFTIRSNVGSSSTRIQVDEYKRPTFQLEFPEVKQSYRHGDTVEVKGLACSFAGVPVQGAKVKYRVDRSESWWWYRDTHTGDNARLAEGETVTAADGSFTVRVPMLLPEWTVNGERKIARFYQIKTHAQVTDQGGESHEGELSLPLGNKPTAFSCAMPDKQLRDSVKPVVFRLCNAAGVPIEGKVRWTVDNGSWKEANANEPVVIKSLALGSGRHTIEAICGTDTLKQEFVLFSLDDERPCVETHDWFYQTASTFPASSTTFAEKAGDVAIQVGTSDPDTHVFYTIVAGEKVLECGSFDLNNAIQTRLFSYQPEYGSGLLLTYAWVKDGKMYHHETTISRPLPDKRLLLTWETFRDRLTPGQKEEWTLRVTRPDGKPAQAQLLATMYDKSLDELRSFQWRFNPQIYARLPWGNWRDAHFMSSSLYGSAGYRHLSVPDWTLSCFDPSVLDMSPWYRSNGAGLRIRGTRMMAKGAVASAPMMEDAKVFDVVGNDEAGGEVLKAKEVINGDLNDNEGQKTDDAQGNETATVRENLNETAFFYPALVADKNGRIALRFTLPESLTTWKVMTLAHDKEMNFGLLGGEAVAKKDVMIQPNMPRFIRQGDQAVVTARVMNTGEKAVSGVAELTLTDPETNKTVFSQRRQVSVDAQQTSAVSFCIDASTLGASPLNSCLYICKVTMSGKGFSDGEQHYLPMLPNVEMVVNTLPFSQHEAGLKRIDLTMLFPASSSELTAKTSKLTVEYTNNPAWMMIQALPSLAASNEKNVVSQAAAFYANSLGAYIMKQNPDIKTTLAQWQQETGSETSLMSSLQKNESLKTLTLDETPWVDDADKESEQKRKLAGFLDENTLNYRLEENLKCMRDLQNSDGSWSWWPGMKGSRYMTVFVAQLLTRLNVMTEEQTATRQMLNAALTFLGKEMVEEVKEMRKLEKKNNVKDLRPSGTAVDVLYIWSLAGTKLSGNVADARNYLVDHLARQTHEFTIYGKAVAAVILAKNGQQAKAAEYLESIRQYSVFKEEMGRYFDTGKAYASWYDYKIPTEVAAIEAIQILEPADVQTVEEMQRWLLQSKRTQAWSTSINSVNAVYAFLNGRMEVLATKEQSTISLDGKPMQLPKASAGLGYVKTAVEGSGMKTLTVKKTSEGTSWGAVYAQFLQPVSEIEPAGAGLTVKRELLTNGQPLKVGDKVKVRITITADRDYDFVQVMDKRAACMEPVRQLSGYQWGYYCSPKDNTTNYYFDRLSKGKHVVETEYYIDREGGYETGTCTVQCAYAPEYTARTAAVKLQVKP
jgi:hypothetical protein